MIFKHRLLNTYSCSVVPGCPNKAKVFSDNLHNHVLSCQIHRHTLFTLRSDDTKLETMFSRADPILSKYTDIFVELMNKYLAFMISSRAKEFDKEKGIVSAFYANMFKYLTTEVRLFCFYEKLAHFQAPCIEETKIVDKEFRISYKYKKVALELVKDLALRLITYPVFKKQKQLLDTLKLARTFLFKDRLQLKDTRYILCANAFDKILKSNRKSFNLDFELPNLNFFRIIFYFNFDRIMCHILEPSLIDYVKLESKEMWLSLRSYMRKTLKIRFSKYPKLDLLSHYRNMGILLHQIGEMKRSVREFKRAKTFLKSKKKGMSEEKFEKKIQSIYFDLGSVYFDLKVFPRAKGYFIKHCRVNPQRINQRVYFFFAYIVMKRRNFNRCLEYIKKEKSKIDRNDYGELKANCYYGLGDFSKAYKFLRKSQDLSGKLYIEDQLFSGHKYRRIRLYFLRNAISFYRGILRHTIAKFYEKDLLVENQYFYRNHIFSAEHYLYAALFYEEYADYETAVVCIEIALRIVKRNYTKKNIIYIEILIRAASIYLNSRNIYKAMAVLLKLWKFKKEDEDIVRPFYEIDMLIGKFLFLTNKIDKIKRICYSYYEGARERVKQFHGYDPPIMISLNVLIGKLYIFDDEKLFHQELNRAYSLVQKFNPGFEFHPFVYRIYYEYIASSFKLRRFSETIYKINVVFKTVKEREETINIFYDQLDINYYQKENYEEYLRKAKVLLSKICIYYSCAKILNKLI